MGEVARLINKLIVSIKMATIAEALVLGVKAGVEPDILFKVLSYDSANSFVLQSHIKNCVMKGKSKKGVFPVDYIFKRMRLITATVAEYHVPLYFGTIVRLMS